MSESTWNRAKGFYYQRKAEMLICSGRFSLDIPKLYCDAVRAYTEAALCYPLDDESHCCERVSLFWFSFVCSSRELDPTT